MAEGGASGLPPLATMVGANTGPFVKNMSAAIGTLTTFKGAALTASGALGILAVKGIADAVDRFAEFDAKLTESQAIMGDLSGDTMAEMESAALEVGATTLKTANEAAESYFFLASAGLDAKQSIAALPAVAAFAQAGMFDMATATDLATDAQSALGLKSRNAQENLRGLRRVTDVLVRANQLANASVEQFSQSLTNKLGPRLRILGKDIEEGTAGLAALADQGIKGRRAGRGLSIVYRDLAREAVRSSGAFEELGIRVFDNAGDMRNLADIVADFERELGGASDQTKTAKLQMLGINRRAIGFLNSLIGLSDEIRRYESELRRAQGATEEVAEKQLETLKSQLDLAEGEWEAMNIAIGGTTTSMLELPGAVRQVRRFFRGLRNDLDHTSGKFQNLAALLHPGAALFNMIEAWDDGRDAMAEARSEAAALTETMQGLAREAVVPFPESEMIEFTDRQKTVIENIRNQETAEQALAEARRMARIQANDDLEALLAIRRRELDEAIEIGEGITEAAQRVADLEVRIAERREEDKKRLREAARKHIAEGLREDTEALVREVEERREIMRQLAGDEGRMMQQAFGALRGLPAFNSLLATLDRFQGGMGETASETTRDVDRIRSTMEDLGLSAEQLGVDLDNMSREDLANLQDRLRAIDRTASNMAEGVVGALERMLFEGESFADGMESMVSNVLRSLSKLALQQGVMKPLTQAFAGAIGGAMGGGGAAQGRQHGGTVRPGQVVVVGEKGPEAFVSGKGGRIASNKELKRAADGGGEKTLNVNAQFNVSALDARTVDQVLRTSGARAIVETVKQAAEESEGFSRKTIAG